MTIRSLALAICSTVLFNFALPIYSQASSIAFDSAADTAYDDGWQATDNGGSGFNPWIFNNIAGSGFAGQFVFTSTDNGNALDDGIIGGVAGDGDIDTPASNGRAWGMFAHSDSAAVAQADRPLTGGELEVGQTVSVDMDNGFIATGSTVGAYFGDGGGDGIGVYFRGGDSTYTALVGQGGSYTNVPTTLGYTDEGLTVSLERTGINTGSLTITLRDGSSQSLATDFINLDPVTAISLVKENSDNSSAHNAYFNSISVTGTSIPEPTTLLMSTVGLVFLAGLRRKK